MKLYEHIQIFKKSIKHLFALSKEYTVCLILSSFIAGVLPYVPIYFSAKLIDALWAEEEVKVLIFYALVTVCLFFLLSMLHTYIQTRTQSSQKAMYCNENWKYSEKAMEMAYETIEDRNVALLRSKVKMDSQTGYNLFYLFEYTQGFISGGTKIAMSFVMSLSFFMLDSIPMYMKWALVTGILVTIVCGVYTTAKGEKLFGSFNEFNSSMNMLYEKLVNYMGNYSSGMDIRLYDMTEELTEYRAKHERDYYENATRLRIKQSLINVIDMVMSQGLKFGTYMILIYAALQGGISVGAIAKYVSCLMLMINAVWRLVCDVQVMFTNNIYLKRYFSYFEIPNNMYQGTLTVEKRDDNEYFVEFRNVSFKYPNTETYALRNVNIKFRVGEKLAIVGMNGSGKTTFIKLMCRLYDPTEGQILLNGVDIRKYDYDEYMSIFSVVFQDFGLFSFSLGQNVATASEYDSTKATECLKKAGFGERMEEMPKGLETILYKHYDKSGVEISGGEAQKIALARALYKDAPFIILDEPTAALDPVAEYEIYSKFNNIVGDKTAIYISHRLASCRFCDNILVFDNGGIVQHGSHDSLIREESGKYHELWHAQAQYYVS